MQLILSGFEKGSNKPNQLAKLNIIFQLISARVMWTHSLPSRRNELNASNLEHSCSRSFWAEMCQLECLGWSWRSPISCLPRSYRYVATRKRRWINPGPLWGGNQGLELPPGSVIFNLWLSSTACICPIFLSDHQLVAGDDCSSLSRVLPEVCPC